MEASFKAVLRKRVPTLYRRLRRLKAHNYSSYTNIYHCCTQKTASQWIRSVLGDPIVFKYTGLDVFAFSQRPARIQDAEFNEPLPRHTFGSNLYIDYKTFLGLEKPRRYKAFYVLRDPRDITVSWYFSMKYSHEPVGRVPRQRSKLNELDLEEGLKYCIDYLASYGLYEAQRSWVEADVSDDYVGIFRYENLSNNNMRFLRDLFEYIDINIPENEFGNICDKHRFQSKTKGRTKGEEDIHSSYRKGISGDWKNYFSYELVKFFNRRTGNIAHILGYDEV